jgi:hypothetical protein
MTTSERSEVLGLDPPQSPAAAPAETSPGATPTAAAVGAGPGRPRARTWLAAIAGAMVLPIAVAAGLTWAAATTDIFESKAADARVVAAADMEREYGIRVNLVAVTADGGLVDVRFTVVDSERADLLLHDARTLPELYVETSGAVLRAPQPHAHKLNLVDGGSYFLLFPNAGGAIQAGTPVSVVIDTIRLAPLDAQS